MDQKRSIDLRWLFYPVLLVILRWSCCLDRQLGRVGFCQSSIRKTTYSAKLIYCLKSFSCCTRESSQPWNPNLSKDKIRFWSLPSSSSQLDSQVPLSPALPDDRRRSWKTQYLFSILFSKRRKRWCWSHFPDKFQAFGKFWLNQELFGLVKLTCRVCLVRLGDRDDSHHYVGFTSAGHCTRVSFSTHIHRKKL